MGKKISNLITYLSLIQETLKYKKLKELHTRYTDVDIVLPEDFIIHEVWEGPPASFEEKEFHEIVFPARDLEKRIKSQRDHLRYLKRRDNGAKYGE